MGFRGAKNIKIYSWLLVGLGILFWFFVIGFEQYSRDRAETDIRENALVISDALWNYNYQGASDYLVLAAKTQRYRRLVVRDDSGKVFQFILNKDYGALDELLKKIKLTPMVRLTAPVVRDGRVIGEISADWESGTVYFALYAFFALVLLAVALNLYVRVLRSKEELEERVRERTEELFESNKSLKQEILDRKQAEEALRRSEELLKATWDSIEYGVLVVTADGQVAHFNSRFCEIWSLSREKVQGRTDRELIKLVLPLLADPNGFLKKVTEIYRDNEREAEDLIHLADGRVLERSSAPLRNKGGGGTRVWIFRDITEKIRAEEERKQLQGQLHQARRMEAIGKLASGIAHDFNNILQALSGYVQLFQARSNTDEKSSRYLSEMEWAVERASDLVQRLLTFSRKVEPELKSVDLNEVVTGAMKILERTIPKMIRMESRLSAKPLTIMADPGQLERVLMNLVTNARDAMPEGGILTVTTEPAVLDEQFCSRHIGFTPGKYVVLKVADTGTGLDQDAGDQIFEPFFTTKVEGEGSGLGLSTVYGIVKNHMGHITYESQEGKGATFLVYLPAGELELSEDNKVEPVDETGLYNGRETILVIDDEEPILGIIRENLANYDYTVLTAQTGEQGLELFLSRNGSVDLVILDLGMPGMGGRACLRELLALNHDIKIIIVTGYAGAVAEEELLTEGARGFLKKPFKVLELLKLLRRTLDGDAPE